MAQRTVLELTQDILLEIGSDEINSISDTIESQDVAYMLRQIYTEMVDEFSLPHTGQLRALVGLGDTSLPNLMQMTDDTFDIKWIKYDCRVEIDGDKSYRDMIYKDPLDFVSFVNANPSTDTTNFQVVQWDANVPLIIHKFKAPSYWTSFEDNHIVFDSYDSNVDSTLQSSKSIYYSEGRPTFLVEDDFLPDLPENLENVLYIQTLSRVLASRMEKINPKVEQREARMRVRTSRNKWRQGRQTFAGPDYGRR